MGNQENTRELEDSLGLGTEENTRELEDSLGLGTEENPSKENPDDENKKAEDEKGEKSKEEKKDEDKKTEEKSKINTVNLTENQVEISKELTKIDLELEKLKEGNTADTDSFYDSLDEILSEEEKQLEFEDKKAYFKAIENKRNEYLKKNSNTEKIEELQKTKKALENEYLKEEAFKVLEKKYPDFDFKKAKEFFQKKLSAEEQSEILDSSEDFVDVYEKTYLKMNPEKNKDESENKEKNIKSEKAPNIPNVNKLRKEDAHNSKLKDGFKSDNELLQEALGL